MVASVAIPILGMFSPALAFVIWKQRDDEALSSQDRQDYLPGLARLGSVPEFTKAQQP